LIPASPPPTDALTVHDTPWSQIFRLRNTVAFRHCERFGRRIPEEEFLSMGNLAIVEAIHTFSPSKQTAFSSYLWLVLQRRMRSVVEHEWQGFVQRTYTGSNANHRRTSQTYVPPEFVEISDTLSTASTQEHLSAIAEVVRFLDTNVTAAWRQQYAAHADTTYYASERFSAFSLLSKTLRYFGDSNPGGETTLILTINKSLCLFKDFRTLRSLIEPPFSGKLPSIAIISWGGASS